MAMMAADFPSNVDGNDHYAARTDRFLRKMGFRQTGGNYVLEGV